MDSKRQLVLVGLVFILARAIAPFLFLLAGVELAIKL